MPPKKNYIPRLRAVAEAVPVRATAMAATAAKAAAAPHANDIHAFVFRMQQHAGPDFTLAAPPSPPYVP